MNLIAGAAVALIGLLIAVLSIAGVIPGLTANGIVLILFGGLIIGMSFINKVPSEDAGESMSTPNTLLNIFVSPSETFQSLRQNPRWLVAVLIMTLFSVTYSNLFLEHVTADRIANYTIDKTLQMPIMNDEAKRQVEAGRQQAIDDAKDPIKRAGGAVMTFAGRVAWFAFLGLLFFLVVTAFGGSIYYWQAFTAAVYAAFPASVIQSILNIVVLYLKDPTEIHPILGQSSLIQDNLSFLVSPADNPVIFTILGSLSLLWFYWIWLNATGLKNTGDRVTPTTGWSASLIAYGMVFLFAVTMALLFPSFIS